MTNDYYNGATLEYTPMTEAEETELFQRYYGGDMVARDAIITNHLRLVAKLARLFAKDHLRQEDAIQAANEGLMQAITAKKFTPGRGVRFATYVRRYVFGRIVRALKKLPHDTVLPDENDELPRKAQELPSIDPEVGNAEFEAFRTEVLEKAMQELSPKEREIIRAVYWDSTSCAEAGRRVSISREAARKAHDRAMAKLQASLRKFRPELS